MVNDARQLLASHHVREVYETLREWKGAFATERFIFSCSAFIIALVSPSTLPALTLRPSEGSKLEPGALSTPETSFS